MYRSHCRSTLLDKLTPILGTSTERFVPAAPAARREIFQEENRSIHLGSLMCETLNRSLNFEQTMLRIASAVVGRRFRSSRGLGCFSRPAILNAPQQLGESQA